MMKPILFMLAVALLLLSSQLMAQSVSPSVLANGGGDGQTASAQLSWTIGEALTTTIGTGNVQITQGFQQPSLLVTSMGPDQLTHLITKVYPNPTQATLYVEIKEQSHGKLLFDLIDAQGRSLLHEEHPSTSATLAFDLRHLAAGNYVLRVSAPGQPGQQSYQIRKVH